MLKFYLDKSFSFRRGTIRMSILEMDTIHSEPKNIIHFNSVSYDNYDHTSIIPFDDKSLLYIKEQEIQDLLDQLYQIGFRPSDEIDKMSTINILKEEIIKRDQIIEKLMDKFVFLEQGKIIRSIQK
jgi:hypothetical protein